jgi:ankyrin repeat protein
VKQANSRGVTALHGAAERGADTIVQFLADRGASLNVKNNQKMTPLEFALGKNSFAQLPVPHESTVALLKKLGALEGKDVK